jgi:redox-sensing transcriptional repressor
MVYITCEIFHKPGVKVADNIPDPAKERLLILMRLLERGGRRELITSARIEALTGWASHTVRKDISFLGTADEGAAGAVGSFGGYDPAALVSLIKKALGLEKPRKFCVAGLGRLGSAYLNVPDMMGSGFELAAGFDTNVNRTEILTSPVPLYPAYKMGEVISRFGIEIALLCVPVEAAQAAAEKLAAAGIRGILNFAPAAVTVPPGIAVRNVCLADELRGLAIKMGS